MSNIFDDLITHGGSGMSLIWEKMKSQKPLNESLSIDLVDYDGEQNGDSFTIENPPYKIPRYRGDVEGSAGFNNYTSIGFTTDDLSKTDNDSKFLKKISEIKGSGVYGLNIDKITVDFRFSYGIETYSHDEYDYVVGNFDDFDVDSRNGTIDAYAGVVMYCTVHLDELSLLNIDGNEEKIDGIEELNDETITNRVYGDAFTEIMRVFDYDYSSNENDSYKTH